MLKRLCFFQTPESDCCLIDPLCACYVVSSVKNHVFARVRGVVYSFGSNNDMKCLGRKRSIDGL